jgi:hypothetical protein
MVLSIKYFTFLLIYLGNSISVYIRQKYILKFLRKVEEEAVKQSLVTQNYAEYLFRSSSRSNKNNQF